MTLPPNLLLHRLVFFKRLKNRARMFSMLALILAASGLFTLNPTLTQAQEQVTLTAIPPRLGDDGSIKVKPGEKFQTSIKVRNASLNAVQIQSIPLDFIIDEDGETPIPIETPDTQTGLSNRWSLASWLVLSPAVQVLQPNQLGLVNVIVEIPADALPGGHYAMIAHQPTFGLATDALQAVPQTQSASQINQRVGSLLYVMVDGQINELAYIRNLTFPNFTEYGPVPFSLTVDNQSDIHIRPQISVEIRNIFGQKVEEFALETKNIFPLSSREFSSQWDRIWGIGYYTAKIVMAYGDQGQVTIASTSFWLLPVTLLLGTGVVILTVLAVLIVIRRHLLHRDNLDRQRVEMLERRLSELESEQDGSRH